MGRQKSKMRNWKWVLPVLAVAAAALIFLSGLENLERGQREEGRLRIEEALRRAAVTCYVSEGVYPPDLEYLTEHYGIQIDEKRYAVHYEIFASNLMPDITVLENDA